MKITMDLTEFEIDNLYFLVDQEHRTQQLAYPDLQRTLLLGALTQKLKEAKYGTKGK